jgi:hypothetical protein
MFSSFKLFCFFAARFVLSQALDRTEVHPAVIGEKVKTARR